MQFRSVLMFTILTIAAPTLVHAQGLKLADIGYGHAMATPETDGRTSIDISGDAAKVIFAKMKEDSTSKKFDGRNPKGDVVDEVFSQSGLTCTRSILFDNAHCVITMVKGRIVGSH